MPDRRVLRAHPVLRDLPGPQGPPGLAISTSGNSSLVELIKAVEPFLVRIDVTGQNFTASGSGFIVDARGYVMTNQHVIDSATSITLTTADGNTYSGKVVASDSDRDIALVKMSSGRNDFPVASLGS